LFVKEGIALSKVEIYFADDSEGVESDVICKGWRGDVYVKTDSGIYHLAIYTLVRLQQDFEYEMENEGRYILDPNIVLVRETNKQEVINTINGLYEQLYFDRIKETGYTSIDEITEWHGIKMSLVRVFPAITLSVE
jgi:hypothetical protein